MKASIIIPSYNASERLHLNLTALNYQDCAQGDFEAIVIDNGSTDGTSSMLSSFKAKFPLKTVYVAENRGIAHGRNRGISQASGDILIFHDSDMIAPKDFVRKHIEAHTKENIVVCGLPWLRLYSYFYSSFASCEIADIKRRIGSYKIKTSNWQIDKYQLIAEEQIKDESFLKLCFDLDSDFIKSLKETIMNYGGDLKEYNLPWRFFITNNASADRKKVLQAGLFDENIVRYGFEDYDLGIRLYKAGGQFKLAYDIISAHQEHSKNVTTNDVIENVNYVCKKYNNIHYIDMILLCLSLVVPTDHQFINGVMSDIKLIQSIGQYTQLMDIFLKVLQTAIKICFNQDMSLKTAVRIQLSSNILPLRMQLGKLKEQYGMVYFPTMFSALVKSILNIEI